MSTRAKLAAEMAIVEGLAFVDVEWEEALTAEDVRAARLDCDAFGRIFPETEIAVYRQILRSIVEEQPTASAVIRALAQTTLEKFPR